jgi:peptide/nickel transport system substrate-binding protein
MRNRTSCGRPISRIALPALVALSTLTLAPLVAQSQNAPTKVVAALSSDIATLDPTIYHAIISFHARLNIFDALTDIGPDSSVVPRFATKWEKSEDAKSWTFTIRTGAKFHNGEPVTIDDVIFSYQKIIDDEKSPTRVYVNNIASIDRVSDTQVRFNLKTPFAPFDRNATLIAVIPKKAYQEMGADAFGKKPIGSGPYRVVNWIKDDRLELEGFDAWWGGAPSIKQVVMRPVPSESARSAALLSGEVDIVPALPPALMQTLSNRPGVKVKVSDGYKVVYMGFNPADPSLKDIKMRQAIDAAVDRNAITQQLLRGMGLPVGQILAKVSFGHDDKRPPTKFDPERAKQLVKESGYKGETITFQYPNDFIASADAVASAVAGYLKAAGINVKLEGMEYNGFYALWSGRKLSGMHMFVFGPSLVDGDVPIFSIFATKGNRGYMFDPKVDQLAEDQRSESDPKKRLELIAQLWRETDRYQPFAFLYNERQAVGLRDGVEWDAQPDGYIRFWKVKRTASR